MPPSGHKPTWRLPFSLRERLRDFARSVDKKLRNRAECSIFQSNDSVWKSAPLLVNRPEP